MRRSYPRPREVGPVNEWMRIVTPATPRYNPMDVAYRKGVECAKAGGSENDCPYQHVPQKDGRPTFKLGFRNEWLKGFRSVK